MAGKQVASKVPAKKVPAAPAPSKRDIAFGLVPQPAARSNIKANLVVGQKHPSWDIIEVWQRDGLRAMAESIGRIIDADGIVRN